MSAAIQIPTAGAFLGASGTPSNPPTNAVTGYENKRDGSERRALFKQCGRCARTYSADEWARLTVRGVQTIPGDELCGPETYELRQCHCTSTLAIIVEPIPDTDRGECVLCGGSRVFEDRSTAPFITVACANHV